MKTIDEYNDKIKNKKVELDTDRSHQLESLKELKDAENLAQTKELKRRSSKYSSGDPRIQKMHNQIDFNQKLSRNLNIEIERSKITMPTFDTKTWMLHGRVLNEQYRGIPNLTVALYDENGKWIRKMNYACTSLQGYFSIIYPAKGATSEIQAIQKLFLTVMDKDKKIIYRETEPLYVKTGTVDYRDIIISSKNGSCTSPEPKPESAPKPAGEEPQLPRDAWVVRGKVTDEENKGIKGLTISLYDKDLFFDDVLGTTTTDENGNFEVIYRTEAFKGLFEKKPDIYLKVLDNKGKVIYTSKRKIRPEARSEESYSINLKK
jgi:hypothetical protein